MKKIIIPVIATAFLLAGTFHLYKYFKRKYNFNISEFSARVYRDNNFPDPLPYRLYVPENYSEQKKYPLVLILHHAGGRGNDNRSHFYYATQAFSDSEIQSEHASFLLVPQCPKGQQWLNTTFKKTPFDNYNQDEIPESNMMKMTIALIKQLQQTYPVDTQRIYVTGFSIGGSGTWDFIYRYPDLFAAALPVTGVSDPSRAGRIKNVPVWAFHGTQDPIMPVQATRNMINALKEKNSNCRFTELTSSGHQIDKKVYSQKEVIDWLFDQKRTIK